MLLYYYLAIELLSLPRRSTTATESLVGETSSTASANWNEGILIPDAQGALYEDTTFWLGAVAVRSRYQETLLLYKPLMLLAARSSEHPLQTGQHAGVLPVLKFALPMWINRKLLTGLLTHPHIRSSRCFRVQIGWRGCVNSCVVIRIRIGGVCKKTLQYWPLFYHERVRVKLLSDAHLRKETQCVVQSRNEAQRTLWQLTAMRYQTIGTT